MFEFTIGRSEIPAKLQTLMRWMPQAVGNALREEAEIEMTEAKRRTPVLTGSLRASGHVTGPTGVGPFGGGKDIQVKLAFGGPAAPYAVFVHENMSALHPNGQAKYLESVLLESAPYMPQRVAARLSKDLIG